MPTKIADTLQKDPGKILDGMKWDPKVARLGGRKITVQIDGDKEKISVNQFVKELKKAEPSLQYNVDFKKVVSKLRELDESSKTVMGEKTFRKLLWKIRSFFGKLKGVPDKEAFFKNYPEEVNEKTEASSQPTSEKSEETSSENSEKTSSESSSEERIPNSPEEEALDKKADELLKEYEDIDSGKEIEEETASDSDSDPEQELETSPTSSSIEPVQEPSKPLQETKPGVTPPPSSGGGAPPSPMGRAGPVQEPELSPEEAKFKQKNLNAIDEALKKLDKTWEAFKEAVKDYNSDGIPSEKQGKPNWTGEGKIPFETYWDSFFGGKLEEHGYYQEALEQYEKVKKKIEGFKTDKRITGDPEKWEPFGKPYRGEQIYTSLKIELTNVDSFESGTLNKSKEILVKHIASQKAARKEVKETKKIEEGITPVVKECFKEIGKKKKEYEEKVPQQIQFQYIIDSDIKRKEGELGTLRSPSDSSRSLEDLKKDAERLKDEIITIYDRRMQTSNIQQLRGKELQDSVKEWINEKNWDNFARLTKEQRQQLNFEIMDLNEEIFKAFFERSVKSNIKVDGTLDLPLWSELSPSALKLAFSFHLKNPTKFEYTIEEFLENDLRPSCLHELGLTDEEFEKFFLKEDEGPYAKKRAQFIKNDTKEVSWYIDTLNRLVRDKKKKERFTIIGDKRSSYHPLAFVETPKQLDELLKLKDGKFSIEKFQVISKRLPLDGPVRERAEALIVEHRIPCTATRPEHLFKMLDVNLTKEDISVFNRLNDEQVKEIVKKFDEKKLPLELLVCSFWMKDFTNEYSLLNKLHPLGGVENYDHFPKYILNGRNLSVSKLTEALNRPRTLEVLKLSPNLSKLVNTLIIQAKVPSKVTTVGQLYAMFGIQLKGDLTKEQMLELKSKLKAYRGEAPVKYNSLRRCNKQIETHVNQVAKLI